jgi:RHS repeat-associated protein
VVSDRKLSVEDVALPGEIEYFTADVTSQNDYYPFGMLLPNRHGNTSSYRYSFNGMEKDNEIKDVEGSSYDFGARLYDARVGRWLSGDAFESKYPHQSTYSFAANSPLLIVDVGGDSIWVTTREETNTDGTITTVHTIHTTIAVYNLSNKISDMAIKQLSTEKLETLFEQELSGELEGTVDGKKVRFEGDVQIRQVSNMDEVDPTDHLIVIVDEMVGENIEEGVIAMGEAKLFGQIAYVQGVANGPWMMRAIIHEWGHNAGLFDQILNPDPKNHMAYTDYPREFTPKQLRWIVNLAKKGELNREENFRKAESDDYQFKSSDKTPYKGAVDEGDIIPQIIEDKK